jgi:hypothetical protein
MEKENVAGDWDVKICPLRNKQCLQQQCAWWLVDRKECAVTRIVDRDMPEK